MLSWSYWNGHRAHVCDERAGGVAGIKEFALQMVQKNNLQDNFYVIDLGRLDRLYQVSDFYKE